MDEIQLEQPQFNIQSIKAIFGLGNIGREYIGTRHNVGFEFLEKLAGSTRFLEEKKLKALIYTFENDGKKLLLVKPTTYMNASGETVQLVKQFYKFEDEEILVVHDDLDLLLGNYKIQFGKGPRIHNGITSIENRLGSNKFWRLRLGIENRTIDDRRFLSGASYVLSKFKNDEVLVINNLFNKILQERF